MRMNETEAMMIAMCKTPDDFSALDVRNFETPFIRKLVTYVQLINIEMVDIKAKFEDVVQLMRKAAEEDWNEHNPPSDES